MTQLRKFRDSISNYFDTLERGVGKRGSTFTDVDAISHDFDTGRFLFREFKRKDEPLDKAQLWVLRELAHLPGCTVWFLRVLDNGLIAFQQFGRQPVEDLLTEPEYLDRLRGWWYAPPTVDAWDLVSATHRRGPER
jgi:hypothetical protein